jgi:cell shape-determining protein MreC
MAKLLSFLVCNLIAPVIYLMLVLFLDGFHSFIYVLSLVNDGIVINYIIGGTVLYWFFGDFFTRLFDNLFYRKRIAKEERKQELQTLKEQDRQLEIKRRELELEYEHLEKILRLQANIDEGKLGKLGEMQNNLKSQKMSDLELLRQQIERMKKG